MKKDGNIDYSGYSLPQLNEALSLINRNKYPLNHERLLGEIAARSKSRSSQPGPEQAIATTPDSVTPPSTDPTSALAHKPNSVPLITRAINILASFGLLAYGAYGVYINDLYLPAKKGPGVHLHDSAALVMFAALICACLNMMSVVLDHHDKRNNEHEYRAFAMGLKYLGWLLFAGSLLMHIPE
ncbi:hypothetical protein [Peristeroidobacter agariperforans]|uniref:hypothetical protein n=1 Tax=Peristeroidobacter agariperforans TaxID=268404 RepID=UPI0018E59B04|nr:hypothetical protein [Peristeroidobacter agariperforans]